MIDDCFIDAEDTSTVVCVICRDHFRKFTPISRRSRNNHTTSKKHLEALQVSHNTIAHPATQAAQAEPLPTREVPAPSVLRITERFNCTENDSSDGEFEEPPSPTWSFCDESPIIFTAGIETKDPYHQQLLHDLEHLDSMGVTARLEASLDAAHGSHEVEREGLTETNLEATMRMLGALFKYFAQKKLNLLTGKTTCTGLDGDDGSESEGDNKPPNYPTSPMKLRADDMGWSPHESKTVRM